MEAAYINGELATNPNKLGSVHLKLLYAAGMSFPDGYRIFPQTIYDI